MKKIIIIFVAIFVVSGCASTQGGLYWGNYSSTLYDLKKEPSSKTQQEHIKSLNDIVSQSEKRNLRVPPGVYAELGQLLLEMGKKDEGVRYLQMEATNYPESQKLVELMLKRTA